jgi:hypothetical protein
MSGETMIKKNVTDQESDLIRLSENQIKKRIVAKPYYTAWNYPKHIGGKGSITEKGQFNYEALNDYEKMIVFVYAWNMSEYAVTRKQLMKEFGWSASKISEMYKELKPYGLDIVPLTDQSTGLLSGRGYFYQPVKQ